MTADKLLEFCTENQIPIREDEPMAQHTSFRAGGAAKYFVMPPDAERLVKLLNFSALNEIEHLVIGNGSNLLISDSGYGGLVICTCGSLSEIKWTEDCTVTAEAGVMLSRLASMAGERGLSGLEFAQGIPGSVGGGVFMNAGAYGGELSNALVESVYADVYGELHTLSAEKHDFAYRSSFFKKNPELTIVSSTFKLEKGDRQQILDKMAELAASRREKQPLEYPSAGSAYKRPEGTFAGKVIEQCGLRGFSIGGAQVAQKHAGFIINTGSATASDIIALMEHVEKTVLEKTGIKLEREIRVI